MWRFAVVLMLVPVAAMAQSMSIMREDVAPVAPSVAVSTGLVVTPTIIINTRPPVGNDHIDQVLATVSATISATTALVTSASVPSVTLLPLEMVSDTGATASPTTVSSALVQQPVVEGNKTTVRVTGNAGAQDRVLQALKAMGLAAVYTRITVEGAELAVPNANADTLATQLHAKGLTAEMGADGAVEVRF